MAFSTSTNSFPQISMNYLQDYLDKIRIFPTDVYRSMTQIRLLDAQINDEYNKVDILQKEIITSLEGRKGDTTPDIDKLTIIRDMHNKIYALLEEKVLIAHQIKNILNSFMEKLTLDLEKYTIELGPNVPTDNLDSETFIPSKGSNMGYITKRHSTRLSQMNEASDVEEEDYEEETGLEERELFCTCRQESWGEMVCCDDPQCEIQWFHYACVGITTAPAGVWYCPDCRPKHRTRS